MERSTVAIYEDRAAEWRSRRDVYFAERAQRLAAGLAPGAMRADLGCGPGGYGPHLGAPLVAMDAAAAMLELVPDAAPHAARVQGDLERLPFRRGGLDAAWAAASYLHVPATRLPLALADLHHAVAVDAPVVVSVQAGAIDAVRDDGDFPGRFFAGWDEQRLHDVFVGAGFDVTEVEREREWIFVWARRARSLADSVDADMRVLVCGLNPSEYAADAGVGFARPGNRFWPAAIEAGLVSVAADPRRALVDHHVGMTDLVKRATPRADAITAQEYRDGVARVRRLAEWLAPEVICFVGLDGWRRTIDRTAVAGVQPEPFGGALAYLMPSTSGANAHASPATLADHLRAVKTLVG